MWKPGQLIRRIREPKTLGHDKPVDFTGPIPSDVAGAIAKLAELGYEHLSNTCYKPDWIGSGNQVDEEVKEFIEDLKYAGNPIYKGTVELIFPKHLYEEFLLLLNAIGPDAYQDIASDYRRGLAWILNIKQAFLEEMKP